MRAVIVSDIIKSTAFSVEQLMAIQEELQRFLDENVTWFKEHDSVFWGRVVRGDTLECYMDDPHYALRTALLLHLRMMLFHVPQDAVSDKPTTMGGMRSGIVKCFQSCMGTGKRAQRVCMRSRMNMWIVRHC